MFVVELKDIELIDPIFDILCTKLDGKLGCACICLHYTEYTNHIREKFIESGEAHGFSKVQIIDETTAEYLSYIVQLKDVPNNGEIIWIFSWKKCCIWQKTEASAKLLEFVEFKTEDEMDAKLDSDTAPDIIICRARETTWPLVTIRKKQNLLPKCKFFEFKESDGGRVAKLALIKARILAMDSEVSAFDAETHLGGNYSLQINSKTILNFEAYQTLPFFGKAIIPSNSRELNLKVSITPDSTKMVSFIANWGR